MEPGEYVSYNSLVRYGPSQFFRELLGLKRKLSRSRRNELIVVTEQQLEDVLRLPRESDENRVSKR